MESSKIAYMKKYRQRPEVKEREKKRKQSPEYREYMREYRQRPEVKERRREYQREYIRKMRYSDMITKILKFREILLEHPELNMAGVPLE